MMFIGKNEPETYRYSIVYYKQSHNSMSVHLKDNWSLDMIDKSTI